MYRPGTVAAATVRGLPTVVMAATDGTRNGWVTPYPVESFNHHPDALVTDVVPLTAAEITSADLTALSDVLAATTADAAAQAAVTVLIDTLTTAYQTTAKPPEPLERGSIAIDADGREWVRVSRPNVARGWVQFETRQTGITWAEIDAVSVQ